MLSTGRKKLLPDLPIIEVWNGQTNLYLFHTMPHSPTQSPLYVTYLRVSTARQGHSGLGLDAQREAVQRFAAQARGIVVGEWVEIESGRVKDRPQLAAALTECRQRKATLLIAKLDRLARNVAFVSSLMEAGVEFLAVDAPYANKLMLHILAAFAEHERELISQRTRAALAAAKVRGVVLGSNGRRLARKAAGDAVEAAQAYATHVERLVADGCNSARQIAARLNAANIPSRGGGKWHAASVARLLRRLDIRLATSSSAQ